MSIRVTVAMIVIALTGVLTRGSMRPAGLAVNARSDHIEGRAS